MAFLKIMNDLIEPDQPASFRRESSRCALLPIREAFRRYTQKSGKVRVIDPEPAD